MTAPALAETHRSSYATGIPLSEEAGIGALTLGGYLDEICARFGPADAAVLDVDGTMFLWSYSDLQERAQEVARALIAGGIGKGERVGLVMTNRLEFLSSLFGIALAGGVATTISTFFTAPELDAVLQAAGCSILLVERHVLKKDFVAMLAELEPQLSTASPGQISSLRYPFLRRVVTVDVNAGSGAVEGWDDFLASGAGISSAKVSATAAAVTPADPALLFFSSGSTGKAKGILAAHRAVCLQLWRWKQWYALEDAPRTWSANGFFFSGNFAMALGGTLTSGGCLVLQRTFDATAALPLIEREKVTMILAWPHQWPQLAAAPGYAEADLSSLRYVHAKSPLAQHPTTKLTWLEPPAYGSTETSTLITAMPSGTDESIARGSHGFPTAGTRVRIVAPLTGETVPLGERGEIAVKGPTVMLGYLGVPLDETLDDEGYFRTGDGGYLDADGRLFWEGRLNDIIKTGGANVSPLEIDEVLRSCPGVKISQTVGVPDELLGELVVACIVPLPEGGVSETSIRAYAKERLASFKIPRRIIFLAEQDLQTTGSAKIKTADLRELARERLEAG